ncbi:MAG: DUF4435 domain-containing protein [Bacteroidaceae bacterium]|nr:DUF4435 domain-containing protein [Bacteroidaceae bacterium]
MATSLQNIVQNNQPIHTIGHIRQKLNGSLSQQITFIIVEGNDDLDFYRSFFKPNNSFIYSSIKENDIMGGCAYLQEIVKTVLSWGKTEKIFGIMDTDYRKYIPFYKYPQAVFHTDYRDMEMMVLSVPNVQAALNNWNNQIQNAIATITPVVRFQGRLRIWNEIFKLGCNFKKYAKISNLFNTKTHSIYTDWEKRAIENFYKGCRNRKDSFFKKIYKPLLSRTVRCIHALPLYKNASDYDICRGHDMLLLLSYQMVHTNIYSDKNIWEKMKQAYSLMDFKATRLYRSIRQWENKHQVQIVK